METDVSVVIATYNGAAYIASSLESIFAQTSLPAEIVIVDDRSTDETSEIVARLSRSSPVPLRFLALPENSGGPGRPYNVGVEAATCEYILLLDQDDLMRPRRLEVQRRVLAACQFCSLVIGRFSIIGFDEGDMSAMWPVSQFEGLTCYIDQQSEYSVLDSEAAFKPLLSRNYAGSMSNFCFSRSWYRRIGPFDETVTTCCDLAFILRAAMVGPIAMVNEEIFDYRWSRGSLQHKDVTRSLLEATMVRLRAAAERPEWAGEELQTLRHSALILANAAVRKGDFRAVRMIAETLAKHKGLLALRQSINKRAQRLIRDGAAVKTE